MKLVPFLDHSCLTVALSGRLDSGTAPMLRAVLDEPPSGVTELVLDFDGLTYVSSAGLRILLSAQKKMSDCGGRLRIRNVCRDIVDIFETTGFDRLLAFEKKRRQLSVEGLERIGRGANGECYKVDEETVLKLYYEYIDEACVAREKDLARKAFLAGVPTAISFDVVACGNRKGVLYELLKAETLARYIEKNVHRLEEVTDMYVGLCRRLHSIEASRETFPDAVELACGYIDACDVFNDAQRAAVRDLLLRAERKNTLIHWDLHPGNIMMQGDEPCLIDMGDVAIGTPFFDLGQIKQVLYYYARMGLCHRIIGLNDEIAPRVWQLFIGKYLGHPAPDEFAALDGKINFFRAVKNVFLYLSGSGGEAMRSRRRDFIFEMLPPEIAALK